jgi:hypothetical protein
MADNIWIELTDDSGHSHEQRATLVIAQAELSNRVLRAGEMPQSNEQGNAVATSAHTTDEVTSPFVNVAAGGITAYLGVTVNASSDRFFLTLEGRDTTASAWVQLDGSEILNPDLDTGVFAWQPGVPLPRYWRIGIKKSTQSNSVTYYLDYSYTRTHPGERDIPGAAWDYANQSSSAQTDTVVRAAVVGQRHRITDIYFAAKGAVDVTIEQGTSVFKWRYYASAASDGASLSLRAPITLAANTAVTYTTSAAIEHTIVVTGYTAV